MNRPLLVVLTFLLAAAAAAQPADHDARQVSRWKAAQFQAHRYREVQSICDRIQQNMGRYRYIEARTGVPWHVTAGLHNMEASGSFTKHLHEGSPLRNRTRWVPKGRPKTGTPPFTWEYSAEDALRYDRMGEKSWHSLGPALSACEGYNGWGYAKYHTSTPTPYLWAGTTVERPGKYVADGKWSSTARSAQIGVAAIWKELERRGIATIPRL